LLITSYRSPSLDIFAIADSIVITSLITLNPTGHFERSRPTPFLSASLLRSGRPAKREIPPHPFFHHPTICRTPNFRSASLISKDEDFFFFAKQRHAKIEVVWVRLGNCCTSALLAAFERSWPTIESYLKAGDRVIEIRFFSFCGIVCPVLFCVFQARQTLCRLFHFWGTSCPLYSAKSCRMNRLRNAAFYRVLPVFLASQPFWNEHFHKISTSVHSKPLTGNVKSFRIRTYEKRGEGGEGQNGADREHP
jgi:hypothetical protein